MVSQRRIMQGETNHDLLALDNGGETNHEFLA